MNAFLIFCKRHRSVVRSKYPHLENRSITKILGEWWAALDGEQKQKYTELARQYKEAFMKANPHFKWYKTTDLRPPMQPPSPPAAPLPQSIASNQTLNNSQTSQPNTNSTPKPPKKRYLENHLNGEFKGSTTSTNSVGNSNVCSIPSPPKVVARNAPAGGPPILDIETANRVIENALSGVSNSYKDSGIHSAFNSELISSHINNVIEEHTRNEEHDDSKSRHNTHSPSHMTANTDPNSSTTATQSTTNSATKSISSPLMPSDDDLYDDNDDDKPLNLSSSTVLHTSNQHIIDHFIDKLLSTGIDGPSSSSLLSLPFTSSSTSMSTSHSFTSSHFPPQSQDSSSSTSNANTTNNRKETRKERSCKGKRYLELLNENKLGKRNKSLASNSGNSSDKDDTHSKINNSHTGSSKWVSGGFDLEEHIAALPQLGDTHLLNALSQSKASKAMSAHKSATHANNHLKKANHSDKDESFNDACDGNNSDTDNDVSISRNLSKLDDNTPKHSTNNAIDLMKQNSRSSDDTLDEHDDDANEESTQRSGDGAVLGCGSRDGMDCDGCDGLAALAEVALRQARNSIS